MIILGIDPGLAIVGYGIIECKGNNYKAIDYGAIITDSKLIFPDRLEIIYNELTEIIKRYKPDEIAFEELFYNKNAKTVMKVAQARGVEVLAGINQQIPLYEYTPLQIKQAVVGYGRAEKHQVQEMIKLLLNLKEIPKPDDVADALAVAFTHGSSLNFKDMFKMK